MKWKCEMCEYWQNGECHAKSPVVIVDGYETGSAVTIAWPETKADDGCGEIKLKS